VVVAVVVAGRLGLTLGVEGADAAGQADRFGPADDFPSPKRPICCSAHGLLIQISALTGGDYVTVRWLHCAQLSGPFR